MGLSQEALAEAAGVHHTYVGLVERGKRNPTIEVAERLARALGKKLSALIAQAERTTSKPLSGRQPNRRSRLPERPFDKGQS